MPEAIILAGGKGTRLKEIVNQVPKPMAPIDGKPFLEYQLTYLKNQGIDRFILSVGYLKESIIDYFGDSYLGVPISYVVEEEPLGTGGGLKFALEACQEQEVLVCNGDTFFEFNFNKLQFFHKKLNSKFSFSIHQLNNNGRYGGIEVDESCKISKFTSKEIIGPVWINAGVYLIDRTFFLNKTKGLKIFSLEDDFFEKEIAKADFYGIPFYGKNFLDIGIPEDYSSAQNLIPEWVENKQPEIKTVFLDRDGVLNRKIDNSYVKKLSELEIYKESIAWIGKNSDKQFFIITNQRGVGLGLMSETDLGEIHQSILYEVNKVGAKISKVYYCTDLSDDSPRRKPNYGMLEEAFLENKNLKKETSVMVGDSLSDLISGRNFGIKTILILNNQKINFKLILNSDLAFNSLSEVNLNLF